MSHPTESSHASREEAPLPMSIGLLLLRVGISVLMLVHGIAKVKGFSEMSEGFPDPLGMGHQTSLIMAIASEVGCSLLLIAGLFTRLAALPLAFTMVVAAFVVHADDPWQKKELAIVYLLVYASIALLGPGRFALDRLFFGGNSEPANQPENAT
ncbi:DoxX family protein [Rhodopirellula halodulae]|uniref:DoxX family protein n=1 Tax=Rhodopirellula halodulae TaxID=2894198 RepID=UPI001E376B38|nr:DoxX family protein [Rhodopirellula sp. JC737]MCC9656207.1 DoxX family protein [Rhodopirellula sp. JC737]